MFKVDNRNSRATCEICSRLTKTPELRHWLCSAVFIFNFEHTSHLVLMFLLLTLRRQCWKLNANWKGSFVYVTKITRFEVIQQMWWCRNSKLYAKSIRAPELCPQKNRHPEKNSTWKKLSGKLPPGNKATRKNACGKISLENKAHRANSPHQWNHQLVKNEIQIIV